jgi:hypothetical protein
MTRITQEYNRQKLYVRSTHTFYFKHFFFRKSHRLWDNVEKLGSAREATDDNIIWRMRIAWWITKVADTHSECVILLAFARQHWLRERASVLCLCFHSLSC